MSLEQIIEVICTVAFMVFSVLAQILNYLRTGKVSSKVDSILPVISSSDVLSETSEKQVSHSFVPDNVDIDNDMDFVTMSRSMYNYYLACERQVLSQEVKGNGTNG